VLGWRLACVGDSLVNHVSILICCGVILCCCVGALVGFAGPLGGVAYSLVNHVIYR
jgi:hypothetical protein